ncbi:MAG: 5-formyltetrahydrofolate cyclo-ligase [Muribaculaceae bacterium]|nr:5-formyltetrahydrofolate cyclo-ligase [Muribaculaceae bacterium]
MDKQTIRHRIKTHKSLLDENEKKNAAQAVFETLENTAAFVMANHILVYHSLPDELPTIAFIDKWSSLKTFYLPRVNGIDLDILPYDRSRLSLGAFHIEEPQGDDICDIENIDMIVVPGVAYDRHGNRVGRGKGYYDRLLARSKAIKVGVAYDFQLVDDIDAEPHDIKVDFIITDKGMYRPV